MKCSLYQKGDEIFIFCKKNSHLPKWYYNYKKLVQIALIYIMKKKGKFRKNEDKQEIN